MFYESKDFCQHIWTAGYLDWKRLLYDLLKTEEGSEAPQSRPKGLCGSLSTSCDLRRYHCDVAHRCDLRRFRCDVVGQCDLSHFQFDVARQCDLSHCQCDVAPRCDLPMTG